MKESIFFFNWLLKFSTFYYKNRIQYVQFDLVFFNYGKNWLPVKNKIIMGPLHLYNYASEIGQILNIVKIKKFIFSFILICQIVPGNFLVHLINECLNYNSVLF